MWGVTDTTGGDPEVISVYDTRRRVIYLPDNWSGSTQAEISILVHEMVHHMQTSSGVRYECPEKLEAEAFAAQAEWLEMFGGSLESDFDLDPLTILVRTNCFI